MKQIIRFYQKLPKKLTNMLEITAILLGVIALTLVASMAKDGSAGAMVMMICIAVVLIGWGPFKRWRANRQAKKVRHQRWIRIEELLAGRSREQVLNAAPFSYSRWPDGDNTFVISDDRVRKLVHSVSSPEEAKLWILERFLADEQGDDDQQEDQT